MKKTYGLRLTGFNSDTNQETAIDKLSALLDIETTGVRKILQRKPIIKKGLSKEKALRIKIILDSIGISHKFIGMYNKDEIRNLISNSLLDNVKSRLYIDPNIPNKKRSNVEKYCAVPEDVDLIAVTDCTVFGSAKRSIAICQNGILWSKSLSIKTSTYSLSWEEIHAHSATSNAKPGKIILSKAVELPAPFGNLESQHLLAALIKISNVFHDRKVKSKKPKSREDDVKLRNKLVIKDRAILFSILLAMTVTVASIIKPAFKGHFTDQQICRAAIGALMGRSVSIIKIDHIEKDVTYTSYYRPNDGTLWKNRCTLRGYRVVWGTDTGRWRTHPDDTPVYFSVSGNALNIEQRHLNGSLSQKRYSYRDLL